MKYVELNNGVKMPMLGLGTYLLTPDEAEFAVKTSLDNGYELIDTANAYVNEKGVGRGIKASKLKREEVFLETKLWPSFYEDDNAIDKTLERLGTDYIDLMILHQPAGNYIAGYRQLEKAYKQGKLKAIGISNFTIEETKEIIEKCEIKPAITQVECHPYYPQDELQEYLKSEGIVLQSWYPLGGRGNDSLLVNDVFKDLAEKYHKSIAQVLLRWHVQKGYVVIPGSKNKDHIIDNLNIFDFEISGEDMKLIAQLNKGKPFYERNEDNIKRFAMWVPDVESQK